MTIVEIDCMVIMLLYIIYLLQIKMIKTNKQIIFQYSGRYKNIIKIFEINWLKIRLLLLYYYIKTYIAGMYVSTLELIEFNKYCSHAKVTSPNALILDTLNNYKT